MTDKTVEHITDEDAERGANVVEVAEALRERKRKLENERREEELAQYKQEQLEALQDDDADDEDSQTPSDEEEEEDESDDPSYPTFIAGRALGIDEINYNSKHVNENSDGNDEEINSINLVVGTTELGELVFRIPVSDDPDSDHKFNRLLRYQGDTWDDFNPAQWEKPIYLKQTAVVETDSGRKISDHYEIEYPPRNSLGLQAFYRAYCWYNCQQTHTVIKSDDNPPLGERVPTKRGIILLRAPLLILALITLYLVHGAAFTALIPTLITFFLIGFTLWNAAILTCGVLFQNIRWLNTLSPFAS